MLLGGGISDFMIIKMVVKHSSLFTRINFLYIDYMIEFPFSDMVGIILLVTGLLLIYLGAKRETKIKMLYFYVLIVFSLLFFIFMTSRSAPFKYISHIIPISIMLTIYMIILLSRVAGKKWVTAFFAILMVYSALNFSSKQLHKRYSNNPPVYGNPSQAYQTLIDKCDPQKEVIFAQYLRSYYLKDFGREVKVVDMLNYRKYEFKTFFKDLRKAGTGWVVFETRKRYHIDPKILTYTDKFFKKYHGYGMDDSHIEMFYFNRDMIRLSIKTVLADRFRKTVSEQSQ